VVARNADVDSLVSELADRQHGAFTLGQIEEVCDRRLAAQRVGRREWHRFLPGTFVLPGHLDEWTAPAAMCLHAPEAVLAGSGAGRWWALDGLEPEPLRLVVPPSCGVRHPLLRRAGDVPSRDVRSEEHGPIRVLDPTRTILDVAGGLAAANLERVVESALRRRLTSVPRLRHRALELKGRGRSGPAQVLAVLDRRASGPSDSDGEVLLLQLLRTAGLPEPVRQLKLGPWRFDLAWPSARLLVELDGSHHRSASQLRADDRKQNAAVLAGWTVLRFTWDQIAHHPQTVVAAVAAALRAIS
jgi:very-short-patch-repair endonuclease